MCVCVCVYIHIVYMCIYVHMCIYIYIVEVCSFKICMLESRINENMLNF